MSDCLNVIFTIIDSLINSLIDITIDSLQLLIVKKHFVYKVNYFTLTLAPEAAKLIKHSAEFLLSCFQSIDKLAREWRPNKLTVFQDWSDKSRVRADRVREDEEPCEGYQCLC